MSAAGAPQSAQADEAVEALYGDYEGLIRDLGTTSPSGLVAINRSYHKHLLVAAASSLESRVKALIPEIFGRRGTPAFGVFVAKAVMARNYHTLFDWKAENASGFFSSFGEACGRNFKASLKEDDELKRQHDAFMRLGSLRNFVVHNDYASYAVDMTPEDVIKKYRDACAFVARIETLVLWWDGEAPGGELPD